MWFCESKRLPLEVAQEAGLPRGKGAEEGEVGDKHIGFSCKWGISVGLLGYGIVEELIN